MAFIGVLGHFMIQHILLTNFDDEYLVLLWISFTMRKCKQLFDSQYIYIYMSIVPIMQKKILSELLMPPMCTVSYNIHFYIYLIQI